MNTRRWLTMTAGLCSMALMAGFAQPADGTKPAQPADPTGQPSEQEMMEMWMKAASPAEAHKVLNAFEGTWKAVISSWMAPGAPPSMSEGTMTNRWVLGGRWLRQEYSGTFMEMPFDGLGYFGHDNIKQQYVGTWMDTMGTGMMVSSGSYDAGAKAFAMTGSFTDPTGAEKKTREVIKIVSNDKHTMEMFGPGPDGKEYKMMEIVYTRAAAPSTKARD